MPASIPIRHGGTFASRDTILLRATFSRSTIAPRASRPTRRSVFLPGSIPMQTTAGLDLHGMSWFLLLIAPQQAYSLAGREHGRSIPFSERTTVATTKCTKGGCKLDGGRRMPGAGLSRRSPRKAPLGQSAFQPYWGKLAVRNDRGDRGNVGIIRSPIRASILPDRSGLVLRSMQDRQSSGNHCASSVRS